MTHDHRFRIAVVLLLLSPGLVLASNSNSLMDISQDGKLLACSNRDSGTVTIIDLGNRTKKFEIPVGGHPEGVSFLGSSHHLATAVYDDDKVVFIDGR